MRSSVKVSVKKVTDLRISMNKLLAIGFVLLFSYGFVSAQNKPFELFIDAVKNEKGGFSGNKENLSTIFNHERIRLGDKFETELWKYLGNDADKHYWIGSFVSSKSYLQGNSPMSELAIQIYQKAIDLIASKNNESSLGRKVTILRRLAVLSKLLGKQDDAVRFRDQAGSGPSGGAVASSYRHSDRLASLRSRDRAYSASDVEPGFMKVWGQVY